MRARGWLIAIAATVAACGRIDYDQLIAIDAVDEPIDADLRDAEEGDTSPPIDALAACPGGMLPLCGGSTVCIEIDERGNLDWTTARDTCLGLGRRLCADAEWALGCACETTLTEMFQDGAGTALQWEWVAEESGGTAQKRGYDTCDAISSHAVTDWYDYRCCADR